MHTTTFDRNIYSVNIAIAWANAHGREHSSRMDPKLLSAVLDMEVWSNEKKKTVKPADVMKDAKVSPYHSARIDQVDVSYPIIIVKYKGSLEVFDGIHRLCAAIKNKAKEVPVITMPPEVFEKCFIMSAKQPVNAKKVLQALIDIILSEGDDDASRLLSAAVYNMRFD